MGAIIESVATAGLGRATWRRGSVSLAVSAARRCLKRAGRRADEVDLLLNSGIYADGLVAEPANAAFIQRRLGANPDPSAQRVRDNLAFDLVNGGCGLVTAAQVAEGFLASGRAGLGLLVASDAAPRLPDWPFRPAGGALLLRVGEQDGFLGFYFESFPEYADLFEAYWSWRESPRRLLPGRSRRNRLTLHEKSDYLRCSVDCVEAAAARFLETCDLDPTDVDLLVASQHPHGFAPLLCERLGLPPECSARVPGPRVPHTSGPFAALEDHVESGRLGPGRRMLFATVGAGLSVALALYRCPPAA